LNQLIREDNEVLNKTITYSYDGGGNITSKKEYGYTTEVLGDVIKNYDYGYDDDNWKDKLGLYDKSGTQVVSYTYDSWGKPFPEVKYENMSISRM
jgi:hypothetical protein